MPKQFDTDAPSRNGWHAVGDQLRVGTPRGADPSSLSASRRWPDPIAEEGFIGPVGDYLRLIEPCTESDKNATLAQLLVYSGNAIGRTAYLPVGTGRHYANENVLIVGSTAGGRKGTSNGDAKAGIRVADPEWADNRIISGLSSGEGMIHAVRDAQRSMQPVREGGRVVRHELTDTDPGEADKRAAICEPEFSSVLRQSERTGNTLSPTIRQAWDDGTLRTLTRSSPLKATGAHISVLGHITEDELKRQLGEAEKANGFMNRFMIFMSRRSKFLPEPEEPDAVALKSVRAAIQAAVVFGKAAGEMKRDRGARELWAEVYPTLEAERRGVLGPLLARASAHVIRLSIIYAVTERSAVIRPRHLVAALAVWDYCERSTAYLFGVSSGDAVGDDALAIIRQCPDGISRSDIMDYFGRNLSSARLSAALEALLVAKKVRREFIKTGGRGRPSERWLPVDSDSSAEAA